MGIEYCIKSVLSTQLIQDKIIQLKQKRKKLRLTEKKDKEEYLKKLFDYQEAEKIYQLCKKALYSNKTEI